MGQSYGNLVFLPADMGAGVSIALEKGYAFIAHPFVRQVLHVSCLPDSLAASKLFHVSL